MESTGPRPALGLVATRSAVSADGGHAMGELCVAILTALVLLLAAALRRPCAVMPVGLRRPVPRRVAALLGRSPPWTAPSLSKLCVLRT